jgi:hypothetical protein
MNTNKLKSRQGQNIEKIEIEVYNVPNGTLGIFSNDLLPIFNPYGII